MPSLAGFEAVLLSLYAAETKSRAGKPVLVSIPGVSFVPETDAEFYNPQVIFADGTFIDGSTMCIDIGYCLPKEAENYLGSHGLKNAVYSIGATNVQDDLFGQLAVCPFQEWWTTEMAAEAKRLWESKARVCNGVEGFGFDKSGEVAVNSETDDIDLDGSGLAATKVVVIRQR
ncbi:hypothetical protein LOK49_LG11G01241 [Camellia lanceoleosa]|uniref:Uncharacterized protein n=1 Tax=Camellia lanceoleosa TaxID=1840588 RepID=A0ACC0G0M6_9ERIC|nr:hypothetical protein LOK49_LG11G01241 [Camellia lanceoleosa]